MSNIINRISKVMMELAEIKAALEKEAQRYGSTPSEPAQPSPSASTGPTTVAGVDVQAHCETDEDKRNYILAAIEAVKGDGDAGTIRETLKEWSAFKTKDGEIKYKNRIDWLENKWLNTVYQKALVKWKDAAGFSTADNSPEPGSDDDLPF